MIQMAADFQTWYIHGFITAIAYSQQMWNIWITVSNKNLFQKWIGIPHSLTYMQYHYVCDNDIACM